MTAQGWLITTRRIYSPFLNSNDLNSKNTLNIPSFLGSAALFAAMSALEDYTLSNHAADA